jgi:hypothetical protein
MVRSWMNQAGAFLLILIGILVYSWDPNFPSAGPPTMALLLLIAGLVWGGLALDNPLRGRRYHHWSRDGSLRAGPARGTGYRSHRSSRHVAASPFAGGYLRPYGVQGARGGVAINAPAVVAGGSFVRDSLRIATREMKENLCGARCSMWAVLSGIVLSLVSADLLLTGREFSLLEQSQVLYIVTSLAFGLGLLVAGILAADSLANEKERATLKGALLLGKVWGVIAAWLLIFAISVPYILVVGFGTSVSWAALVYTFVLGSLCVAGFASLILGISVLSRSGRGVTLASTAVFIAMAAPTLLGTTSQKSWFNSAYNVLSPVAHARLSLDSVIVDRESLLVQLPHIGALAAFATVAAVFAAFAAHRVTLEGRPGA